MSLRPQIEMSIKASAVQPHASYYFGEGKSEKIADKFNHLYDDSY